MSRLDFEKEKKKKIGKAREFCFVKFALLRGKRISEYLDCAKYANDWLLLHFHENGDLRMLNLFDVTVVDGSMGTTGCVSSR